MGIQCFFASFINSFYQANISKHILSTNRPVNIVVILITSYLLFVAGYFRLVSLSRSYWYSINVRRLLAL